MQKTKKKTLPVTISWCLPRNILPAWTKLDVIYLYMIPQLYLILTTSCKWKIIANTFANDIELRMSEDHMHGRINQTHTGSAANNMVPRWVRAASPFVLPVTAV